MIEQKFSSPIMLPDIPFDADGFVGEINYMFCVGFNVGASAAAFEAGAGIEIAFGEVQIACGASWHFKLKSWPHFPSGDGTVEISVGAGTGIMMDIVVTESAGKPGVAIGPGGVQAAVDITNMQFSGGIIADILQLLTGCARVSVVCVCMYVCVHACARVCVRVCLAT